MADDLETAIARALAEQAGFDWDKLNTNQRDSWRPHARAAIAVMRARMMEPDTKTVDAGTKVLASELGVSSGYSVARAVFRAMAGVILGESATSEETDNDHS